MRNKISKLIAVLLICIMALGNVSVFAADDADYIMGAGIAPNALSTADKEEAITRGEYAYIMAGLMTTEELLPVATRFKDVTNQDYYSGQIEYLANQGIAGGYGNGYFGENDPVTLETAYIFLMRILERYGLIRKAETLNGSYTNFAYTIGLKPGTYTNEEGYVTKDGAMKLAYNALTTELFGAYLADIDGNRVLCKDPSVTGTLLSNALDISAYDGVVSAVDAAKKNITFTVTKNTFKSNPVILNEGAIKIFLTEADMSVYEYDHSPVTVWVNSDGELVYITESKNIEIKYVNVYSINGDNNTNNAYGVATIDRVMLYNDEEEYTVSEDATFRVNGKVFNGRFAFAGKFTKVVLRNDEIIHMESWDLVEGGLVSKVEETQIKYTKGNVYQILRQLDKYETQVYILDGKIVTKEELPENALIYYYANAQNKYLVVVASNLVVSGILSGTEDDMLIIGENAWAYNSTAYYKAGEANYKRITAGTALAEFYGRIVDARLAPSGKIHYLSLGAEEEGATEFYGAVTGVKADKYDTTFGEVQVYVLGDEVKKEIYKTTEKTVYENGLSFSILGATANKADGTGVYKFRLNKNGVITKVSKPQDLYGWNGPAVGTSKNITLTREKVRVNLGGQNIFLACDAIFAMYEIDGELTITRFAPNSSSVTSKAAVDAMNFTLYGEGQSSNPSLVILTGSLEQFGRQVSEGDLVGVITKKQSVITEEGKIMKKLTVETAREGMAEYLVTEEYAQDLNVDMCITYRDGTIFSENEIYVTRKADMSGDPETWLTDLTPVKIRKKGQVVLVDNNRVVLDDGNTYFFSYNMNGIKVDISGDKREYSGLSISDIVVGDTIYVDDSSSYGIALLILVR